MYRRKQWCAGALVWLLAAGTCLAQDTESNESKACHADPQACLTQKLQELETRGTIGLDLHPQQDGDTMVWAVHRLIAGGAAKEAGLEPGDIILRWNGEDPSTPEDLRRLETLVSELKVGEEFEVEVLRGYKTLTFTLTPKAADQETIGYWLRYFARKQHVADAVVEGFLAKEGMSSGQLETADG